MYWDLCPEGHRPVFEADLGLCWLFRESGNPGSIIGADIPLRLESPAHGLDCSILPVEKCLKCAGENQIHAVFRSSLPGEIRQDPGLHLPAALGAHRLLSKNILVSAVGSRGQVRFHPLHIQIPSDAVRILHGLQHRRFLHNILPQHAGFQTELALIVQFQLQLRHRGDHIRLCIRGVASLQLRELGKGQQEVLRIELAVLPGIKHMQVPIPTEGDLVPHYFLLLDLRRQRVIQKLFRPHRGQFFLQEKRFFPCLPGEHNRIFRAQQLHTLRYLPGTGKLCLLRNQCFRQRTDPTAHHDFPGGDGSGIHKAGEALCPDPPLLGILRKIPFHLERNPGIENLRRASLFRGVQNPDHDTARKEDAVHTPLLSPQNLLSPGGKDPAHIRKPVRKLQLLGRFHILDLPHRCTQIGYLLLFKCQLHSGSLLLPQ